MRSPRRPARDRLELGAVRAAGWLLTRLGPAAADRLGGNLGGLLWALGRHRRRVALANLRHAFPGLGDTACRRLGAASAGHLGRSLVDLVRSGRWDPARLAAAVEWRNPERLEAALAAGRGVIVATAHLGAWELAALALGARLGESFLVVARRLDNPLLDRELNRLRTRFGGRVVDARGAARAALRQLRSGGAVGLLVDQRVLRVHAVEVPFFGRPARSSPLAARLADRSEALLLPMVCRREGPERCSLEWLEPIDVRSLAPAERAVVPLTARLTAVVEARIRRHPEQWLWLHDRWRP